MNIFIIFLIANGVGILIKLMDEDIWYKIGKKLII
jgi:hypothetical protein